MPNQEMMDKIAQAKIVNIEEMSGMTLFIIEPQGASPAPEGAESAVGGMEDADVTEGEGDIKDMAKKGYITVAIPNDMLGDAADYSEGQTFGGEQNGSTSAEEVAAMQQYR